MSVTETIAGQNTAWKLIKKLGEGDAGEVYLVESLLENQVAILKRPHRGSFPSEMIRQASQIETEGKILRALEGFVLESRPGKVRTPAVLDVSKPGAEFSERYFIVIEKASGFDLNSLARGLHGRLDSSEEADAAPGLDDPLVSRLAAHGVIPPPLLLRILLLMLEFIEQVHHLKLNNDGLIQDGAIWNDIKPDHLFWDAFTNSLTLIDWGNGKFLEADGTTKDRRSSRNDDSQQFVSEMGRFLAAHCPTLHQTLDWPQQLSGVDAHIKAQAELKEKIELQLAHDMDELGRVRVKESELVQTSAQEMGVLEALEELQKSILGYGELPDDAGLLTCAGNLATTLATHGRLSEFQQVCSRIERYAPHQAEKWQLLGHIAAILLASAQEASLQKAGTQALVAGLVDDWPTVLWELMAVRYGDAPPEWWNELSHDMRKLHFNIDPDLVSPYLALNRVLYVLQAAAAKLTDTQGRESNLSADSRALLALYNEVIQTLKVEILPRWSQLDPPPPDAGLNYKDVERILDDVGKLVPNARTAIVRTLDQPAAQVRIVLEAWGRREFDTARRALRRVLLWDPHRWRVLAADHALLRMPIWLDQVRMGPQNGQPLRDYLAEMELDGRELRNQIGPARWLDLLLSTMQRLRKGERSADLVSANPELVTEMPWINRVGWLPPEKPSPSRDVSLTRAAAPSNGEPIMMDEEESRLGQDQGFMLAEPLDTWAPEARGSSARVFLGFLRTPGGKLKQAAVKVMRRDRDEYALPLFSEEVQVLELMKDVPGVVNLLELGFIKLDRGYTLPPEEAQTSARGLRGEVHRFGVEKTDDFLAVINSRVDKGWLPYLALEKKNQEDNLMLLCDAGYTHGRFLPVLESLRIAIQICDILHEAHNRQIVYRDHKILHYYWQETHNGVFMIDWNVAKIHPQGLTAEEKQFDLVQFGARALHHMLTGRPAPGALPIGPTRPEEIESAAHTYKVNWTYDDQRLPYEMKDLLERVLAGEYLEASALRANLHNAFNQFNGLTNG